MSQTAASAMPYTAKLAEWIQAEKAKGLQGIHFCIPPSDDPMETEERAQAIYELLTAPPEQLETITLAEFLA